MERLRGNFVFKVLAGIVLGAALVMYSQYHGSVSLSDKYLVETLPEEEVSFVIGTSINQHPKHFRSRRNVIRQIEEGVNRDGGNTKNAEMWIAKNPGKWGEIIYELPVEREGKVRFASLNIPLAVHLLVDPLSEAELWLRSKARPRWTCVYRMNKDTVFHWMPTGINVTDWIVGAESLEVKFRLKGYRMLAHPDPDSLIGPAGAQAMRSFEGASVETLQLSVWSGDTEDDTP